MVPGEGGLVGVNHLSGRGVRSGETPALDTALVMSGGSVNGIFLQLGFLQAVCATELWSAVGWLYGTSAGALSGWVAALDAIDEHERFLMELQPADVFAAHDLWRTPFVGLHRYTLPETVAERLGDPVELARRLKAGPCELTVVTTDIGLSPGSAATDDPFERAFSSRQVEPETLVAALFASAAISTYVLPTRIGAGVYADGGWVRNFPLAYAYREPSVKRILGCRYRAPASGVAGRRLQSLHRRMSRLDRLRVARGVTTELREAIERHERGEPMHLVDTIARLSHIAVYRNSELEVQLADERDRSLQALQDVREHMREAIASSTRGSRRARAPGIARRGLRVGGLPLLTQPRRPPSRRRRLASARGAARHLPPPRDVERRGETRPDRTRPTADGRGAGRLARCVLAHSEYLDRRVGAGGLARGPAAGVPPVQR